MFDLTDLPDFARQVVVPDPSGCWLWIGRRDSDGYGRVNLTDATGVRREFRAHVAVYEAIVGDVPVGLVLDHVAARGCANRACVNPAHLEPVTSRENTLRGSGPSAVNARKTHCVNGHEFTPENTYMSPSRPERRACRRCHADRTARKRIDKRARAVARLRKWRR